MKDLFEKLRMEAGLLARYAHLSEDYFFFPSPEGNIGPYMWFDGKGVLNWSLNNYLGLTNHPEVKKADADDVEATVGAFTFLKSKPDNGYYRSEHLVTVTRIIER